jgi:hypothetical protein
MTALRAIPGRRAIVVAKILGVPLYKYTDSTERSRSKLSIEEAHSILEQAPKLIHVVPGDVADAIEDSQIRELRNAAGGAADSYQVEVCDRALGEDTFDHHDHEGACDLTREEARIWCALAIADAQV